MKDFTFLHISTIDSTNAYLQRLQDTEEISGQVIAAREQTAGKGMGSNNWESAKGMNLTFSVGIDTSWLPAVNQFMLSQLVPLGLLEVLDAHLPSKKLKIKWPNDLYFDGHKLGGILINSTIGGSYLIRSIIGIGLNVNQMQFADWPTRPISMKMITGKDYDLEPLLKELVSHIGNLTEETRKQAMSETRIRQAIDNRYYSRLFRYHEWAEYKVKDQRLRLYMTGIDTFGRLQLIDDAQIPHIYDIKEISYMI